MNLYDSIFTRKSVRKFNQEPLDQATLQSIDAAVANFAKLYDDVALEHRVTDKVKGMLSIKAPQYLIISGTGADKEMEAAGFLYQQLSLWMTANDIGSVWLGVAKDARAEKANDIITVAFGRATEPVTRSLAEFKRNPIAEITNAPDDICIQAAHLAPSGMNGQPWYFEKTDEKVLVYRNKPTGPTAQFYKLGDLDMGIALAHYAIAAEKEGLEFNFSRSDELPSHGKLTAFGIIR
ncbi:MAG: hypothetical protein FWD45_06935 [Coriobacteriia bacterium]|nr:hypothetical protein [Coriobacteriia bacterium]